MMTANQYRTAALEACCLAGVPCEESSAVEPSFDLVKLPAGLQRPAAALMSSATAYMLMHEPGFPVRCFRWAGRWWVIRQWTKNRLHISPFDGGVGLLTPSLTVL